MENLFEDIDKLIEINLNLIAESENKSRFIFDFVGVNEKMLHNPERLAEIMEQKSLIEIEYSKRQRCDLTEFGYKVWENGGWIKHLEISREVEAKEILEQQQIKNLEIELAKSNIEANELNKKVAKQNEKNAKKNRVATWINIAIGFLNLSLIAWQFLKNM